MNIDEMLRTSVTELARGVTPPPVNPGGVRARATTIRRRQWLAAAAGTAAVVLGAGAITTGLADQGATPPADDPSPSPSSVVQGTALVDGTGDMWGVQEGATNPKPEPAASIGDFVRVTFIHSDTRVVVKSTFVELKPTGNLFSLGMLMRDQDGTRTHAAVSAGRNRINGVATHTDRDGKVELANDQSGDIDCRVQHSLDYQRNTVLVSFPRECVGNPKYLQFRMFSEYYNDQNYTYVDNPHNIKNFPGSAWTDKVRSR